jgi:hypothetical protein
MNEILSFRQFRNPTENMFHNVSTFYFPPKSCLNPYCSIFYYYFFIIDNKLYINDIEFNDIFAYFTEALYNAETKAKIFDYDNLEKIEIENGIFVKNNYTNAGHAFGNIVQMLHKCFRDIENISEFKIIVTEDLYKYNAFLISCILLFVCRDNLVILKPSQRVTCKNLVMCEDFSAKVDYSIVWLLNQLKITNLNKIQHENIFLIKSDNTQNTTPGAFNNEYNVFFRENGFVQIIPETMDISELFNVIYNSKNVIMSWGCCSYLNSIFANECNNILVLGHIKYKHEYDKTQTDGDFYQSGWFPKKSNKALFIGDLPSELSDDIIDLLKTKIAEFGTNLSVSGGERLEDGCEQSEKNCSVHPAPPAATSDTSAAPADTSDTPVPPVAIAAPDAPELV